MNPNEMQSAWNSPRNNLPTQEQQRLTGQFTRQMIRRRRFQAIWLISTFIWLMVITGLAIRTVIVGKVNLEQEWGLLPILIVPWAFAFHFLRRHLSLITVIAGGELPVIGSVRAALACNQSEQSHLKLVSVLFIIMIPILALTIGQLHAAGKASSNELASMAVFFGAMLFLGGAGIAARYFGRVLPQQKQLNSLLTELTNAHQ